MSSYQIYEFDGQPLPLYNPQQDLGTGAADSTLLSSVGGSFDTWPGIQRVPDSMKFTVGGIYAATEGSLSLVDESGNRIVDHAGNRILVATASQYLRQQVDGIRAKRGATGRVWRRRWDDPSVTQWKTARLLAAQEKSDSEHRTIMAQIDCVFESPMAAWRDAAADVVSANLVAGGQAGLLLGSDGNATIEDSVITVTAGGAIASLQFSILHLGIDLRWAGALGAGSVLVIDCGTDSVTVNGAAAYSGFSLGPGHSARTWLPLPPGAWAMLVASDGPGTVSSSHYDQWV